MFTVAAFILMTLVAWLARRTNEKDRAAYDAAAPDMKHWVLLLHLRQDMKLVAFLLGAVIVMLGVVADRLP